MIEIKHKTDDMEFTITVHSGCRWATLTMKKQPVRAYRISGREFEFRGIRFRSASSVEVTSYGTVFILGWNSKPAKRTCTFSSGSPVELLDFVSRLYMGLVLIEETYK